MSEPRCAVHFHHASFKMLTVVLRDSWWHHNKNGNCYCITTCGTNKFLSQGLLLGNLGKIMGIPGSSAQRFFFVVVCFYKFLHFLYIHYKIQ